MLGDGSQLGLSLSDCVQPTPDGLAQAFILGKEFIGDCPVTLVLGDNIFYGQGLSALISSASAKSKGASIFAYQVSDPERFGVVEFDKSMNALSIEEKAEDLLAILELDPWQNPPPYEKLVGDLTGAYSRRINIQHRLVCQVLEVEKVVKVLRLWAHYE